MHKVFLAAFVLTALGLIGSASVTWLQWGYWDSPSMLYIATALGAVEWARDPESWLGVHRLLGGTPLWSVCSLGAVIAAGYDEKMPW